MSTRKKREEPEDVRDFLGSFLDRHSVPCGRTARFFVSDQDCMEFGEFIIRAMVGWAGQYELLRVPVVPSLAETTEDKTKELEELEDEEMESERKFIN